MPDRKGRDTAEEHSAAMREATATDLDPGGLPEHLHGKYLQLAVWFDHDGRGFIRLVLAYLRRCGPAARRELRHELEKWEAREPRG